MLLPLFNVLSTLAFGRYLGRKGSILIAITNLTTAWTLVCIVFANNLFFNSICLLFVHSWCSSGLFTISFELLFDNLSIIMIFLVLSVSLIVHIYSIDYMSADPHLQRFVGYLSLFTFFMLILLTSNNFVQLFLGWEGVGLCSYLLISFWYNRLDACKSAIKAVVYNKIGDCALLFGMSLVYLLSFSLNFQVSFLVIPFFVDNTLIVFYSSLSVIDVISIMFIIAAMGKSAQFLLHPWLADAMEGPTPVSALIHAATMVTAGIYLIMRCSFILEYSNIMFLVTIIGTLTIFFASTTALFQYDVKKIIAYSTCSQLGYMFTVCSVSGYKASFFHLFTHGFFKALLFLSAGLLIHNLQDEQDIRKMGGLLKILPFTYSFFLLGSMALIGTPFLSGFYSKDYILEILYSVPSNLSFFCFHIAILSTFLTSIYSLKLLYYVFLSEPHGYKSYYRNVLVDEGYSLTLFALTLLALFSLFIGFLFKDLFIGAGSNSLHFSILEVSKQTSAFNYFDFAVNSFNKSIPLYFFVSGCLFCFLFKGLFISFMNNTTLYWTYLHTNQAWFVNYLYYQIGLKSFQFFIVIFYLDKLFFEFAAPKALQSLLKKATTTLQTLEYNVTFTHLYFYFTLFLVISFL